jgi:hypothetical protein
MSDSDPLHPEVRRLFESLMHAGQLSMSDPVEAGPAAVVAQDRTIAHGEAGKQALGTWVRFAVCRIGAQVAQVRYQAYGCPHTLAACEWLARELEAGKLASIGGPHHWSQVLGIPTIKLGRLLWVEDALRTALEAVGLPMSLPGETVVK